MIVSHLTNYNKKKRIPVIYRIYNKDKENTCRKSEVHMKKRSDFSYISHVYYIYRVFKKSRTGRIFHKLCTLERNVLDKSCMA